VAALAWLLIPFAAAVGAVVWAGWPSRRPGGCGDAWGAAGYEASRAAMERSRGHEHPPGDPADARHATAATMAHPVPEGRAPAAD